MIIPHRIYVVQLKQMSELASQILIHAEVVTREAYATRLSVPGHGLDHSVRVVTNARLICEGENMDPFIHVAAAWIHDIGRIEEWNARDRGEIIFHAESSARQVPDILHPFRDALGITTIEAIQRAVGRHMMLNQSDDSVADKTLKDADRLDTVGAIGIMRTFMHRNNFPPYNPDSYDYPFGREMLSFDQMNPQNTWCLAFPFENLMTYTMLNSDTARRLAVPKMRTTVGFLLSFAREVGLPDSVVRDYHRMVEARKSLPGEVFKDLL